LRSLEALSDVCKQRTMGGDGEGDDGDANQEQALQDEIHLLV